MTLTWRYHKLDQPEKREEWVLSSDDYGDMAKFIKHSLAFAQRHGIKDPTFVFRVGYQDTLPWKEIVEQLNRGNKLFSLSDAGITSLIVPLTQTYNL